MRCIVTARDPNTGLKPSLEALPKPRRAWPARPVREHVVIRKAARTPAEHSRLWSTSHSDQSSCWLKAIFCADGFFILPWRFVRNRDLSGELSSRHAAHRPPRWSTGGTTNKNCKLEMWLRWLLVKWAP